MATFKNMGKKTAVFLIGRIPGTPPEEFSVGPGEYCEVAEGYAQHLAQYGLALCDKPQAPAPEPVPEPDPEPEPKSEPAGKKRRGGKK